MISSKNKRALNLIALWLTCALQITGSVSGFTIKNLGGTLGPGEVGVVIHCWEEKTMLV